MPWLHTRKWDRDNRVDVPITRWANDFPRNRLILKTLPRVLADYAAARAKDYSKEDAAAYAMACKEACWHSGNHVAFKDKASDNKWWHTARINKEYTLERFLRVLGNTLSLGKSLGIHTLETVCGVAPDLHGVPYLIQEEYEPYHNWIGQHFNMDSPRGVEVRKLHDKYASIACHPLNLSTYSLLTSRRVLRQWKKVKRGRDLFVKGWGAFDICSVGRVVFEEQLAPSPLDFTATGYGLYTHHLRQLMEDEWLMQYVTRWRHWWWAPVGAGEALRLPRMDEIIRAKNDIDLDLDYPNEELYGPTGLIRDMSVHPQHILDIVHEARARRQAEYTKRNVPLQNEWPWVREVMQPVETSVGTLVPIDTPVDLQETSKVLNNCASGYAMDIQVKRCALVKLIEDGVPKALAEYNHMGVLRQCSGVSNRKVSKEIRQVFESYKPRWQDK